MPDPQQPTPIQPDPHECSPLIQDIEKMLDISDPEILEDQSMLIHTYAMRMLVVLYEKLDEKISENIADGNMEMAHLLARLLDSKLSDLKRYTYSNYDQLNKWQGKALKVLVKLRRTLGAKDK